MCPFLSCSFDINYLKCAKLLYKSIVWTYQSAFSLNKLNRLMKCYVVPNHHISSVTEIIYYIIYRLHHYKTKEHMVVPYAMTIDALLDAPTTQCTSVLAPHFSASVNIRTPLSNASSNGVVTSSSSYTI